MNLSSLYESMVKVTVSAVEEILLKITCDYLVHNKNFNTSYNLKQIKLINDAFCSFNK